MITIKVEIEDDGERTCFNIMGEKDDDKEPTGHEAFFAHVAREMLRKAADILRECSDANGKEGTRKVLKKHNIDC